MTKQQQTKWIPLSETYKFLGAPPLPFNDRSHWMTRHALKLRKRGYTVEKHSGYWHVLVPANPNKMKKD